MKLSAELSAIAILIHTAIEDLNPSVSTEYYDCEALDCASGIGIAVTKGWLDSGATSNEDGTINGLFLVKLTEAGRAKVSDLWNACDL
jgi:hypothetical protein